MHRDKIRTFDSPASLKSFAAEHIIEHIVQAQARPVPFSLVLSGGSTPKEVYQIMSLLTHERSVPWSNTHLFWGDERCVPPEAPESNFGMVRDALLSRVKIPGIQVHRIRGEVPAQQGALEYEKEIVRFAGSLNSLVFDLVLLGLGDDGHTASLFPSSQTLSVTDRLVTTTVKDGMERVTLTLTALNSAREILFLVTGKGKARAVRDTLVGPGPIEKYPARGVNPRYGKVLWLLDREAASFLKQ